LSPRETRAARFSRQGKVPRCRQRPASSGVAGRCAVESVKRYRE
jgi:hypothetical protein